MAFFNQKVHWKAVWEQVGLLLHVPAGMATLSIIISIIFGEWFAIFPLACVAVFGFGIGQLLYHVFSKEEKEAHLWDAMIIASLGWLFCSILASVPFFWIAAERLQAGVMSANLEVFAHPLNALFETFSGYTSTGLTMLQNGGYFPHVLQWWRSFLEWAGGIGLVVFVLSLTHLNLQGYQLYYAEARTEQMSKNITGTAHWLWGIYLCFTVLALFLFWIFGMPIWEAINHAMTVVSTGGFTITNQNFAGYNLGIQLSAIFIMLLAAMSFIVHFRIIREGDWRILYRSLQHRFLFLFFIGGWLIVILLNYWNGTKGHWIHSFFEWTSALTTCGYNTTQLSFFNPMVKLFLIMGMFIGGATGSTAGGLKIRRLLYLASGVFLRLTTITEKKEKQITCEYHPSKEPSRVEPPGIDLPDIQQSERLFTAGVLFFLWALTLLTGWFLILRWTPTGQALNALFEVTSAMSNVGLTSGLITPELPAFAKCIYMFLMWIGRLEIIPAIILIISLPLSLKKRSSHEYK